LDTGAPATAHALAPELMRIMALTVLIRRCPFRTGGRGWSDSTFLELACLLLYIR
jgi:hypothetical protein